MVLAFLENVLNLGIFTHVPILKSKLSPKFYQKYEDDIEHQVIYIFYELHFVQVWWSIIWTYHTVWY